ncbi:hypothetical protein TKK_0007325 [Trichogramma kaykai]|uniref:Odorant receptor n=1 Tax=Trichogramma kaykai TaxID=54128 RepID=A0ABD2X948_9HYME
MTDQKGLNFSVGPCKFFLSLLGIWPDIEGKQNCMKNVHFLIPAFVMFYFCSFVQTIKAIQVRSNLNAVLTILTTSDISVTIGLVKLVSLWYHRKVLGSLINFMTEDWKNSIGSELETMWKNAKLGRLTSIIIIALAEGTIVSYSVLSCLLIMSNVKQQKLEYNATVYRPLYFDGNFLYDVQKSPIFEIIWIFQFLSSFFAASSFSAIDGFFSVLVLHLCGNLHNLNEYIRMFLKETKTESDEFFMKQLGKIVNRHEQLKMFSDSIENSFNFMFLLQLLTTSLILCLQGYQFVLITTTEDTMSLFELLFLFYYIMCFNFSIFMYCFVAEILRKESMDTGNAVLESDWYELTYRKAKNLILIIARAQQPFEIRAGKFITFSLGLYCSILKNSGGYLSALLAVKDRLTN